jgi:hypothetical protein
MSYSGCLNLNERILIETRLTASGWRCFGKLFVTVYNHENKASAQERESFVAQELTRLGVADAATVTFIHDEHGYDVFSLSNLCCLSILSMHSAIGNVSSKKEPLPFESPSKTTIESMQVLFVAKAKTVAYDVIVSTNELQELMDTVEHGKHQTLARDDYIWAPISSDDE